VEQEQRIIDTLSVIQENLHFFPINITGLKNVVVLPHRRKVSVEESFLAAGIFTGGHLVLS
jgi:hypothetical protein